MSATIVQSKSVVQNLATASIAVTLDQPALAGNEIIVIVAADAYVPAAGIPTGFTEPDGARQEVYLGHYVWRKTAVGGERTVTATPQMSCHYVAVVMEVAGLSGAGSVIASAGQGQIGHAQSPVSATPSISFPAGNRFIVATVGGTSEAQIPAISGWSDGYVAAANSQTAVSGGTNDSLGVATKQLVAADGQTTSTSATWANNFDPQSRTAIIVAFHIGPKDTTPPTMPTGLQVTARTATTITVTWSAATDDVSVKGYEIYVNGVSRMKTSTLRAVISGLEQRTSYGITIKAYDTASNYSAASAVVTMATLEGEGRYAWTGSRLQLLSRRVAPLPLPMQRVAIIGDSLTDQDGAGEVRVPASLRAVGWPSNGIFYYAWPGKEIAAPDYHGDTTVANIRQARAALGEPDVWVIALCTNSSKQSDAQIQTDLGTVLGELGPSARVLWVNGGTSYTMNPDILNINRVIAEFIATRPNVTLVDWYTYVNTLNPAGLWSDATHMTVTGYDYRNAYIAQATAMAMRQ